MQRMLHQFKAMVADGLAKSGVLRTLHRRRRPHVLVLAYHRVTPDAELASCAYPAMHVSTSTFDAQLAALSELYRIVPLRDLGPILAGTEPLREHVAVITFDDGYRDNYRNALPILAARNIAATFFVSVDFVDRGESFWFDRVAAAARAWSTSVAARPTGLPEGLVKAFDSPGSLAERVRAAASFLKTLPDDERRRWVQVLTPLAQGAAAADAPMEWDEIRALRQAGMSIGAHGMRHGILTRMPGDDAAREIRDSVSLIGQRVGAPVETFAYPNGDVDDAVADLARRAGVRFGFTMAGRNVGPGPSVDALRIARRNVCEDTSRGRDGRFSAAYFWCEMTGVFDVLTGRRLRKG